MQLTFPSLPTNPTVGAASPGDHATSADGPLAMSAGGAFADLLAGAGPSTTVPTEGVGSGAEPATPATAGGENAVQVAPAIATPALLSVGLFTNLGLPATTALQPAGAPEQTGATDSETDEPAANESLGSTPKDVVAQGDVQAISVAMMQAMVSLMPPPTVATTTAMATDGAVTNNGQTAGKGAGSFGTAFSGPTPGNAPGVPAAGGPLTAVMGRAVDAATAFALKFGATCNQDVVSDASVPAAQPAAPSGPVPAGAIATAKVQTTLPSTALVPSPALPPPVSAPVASTPAVLPQPKEESTPVADAATPTSATESSTTLPPDVASVASQLRAAAPTNPMMAMAAEKFAAAAGEFAPQVKNAVSGSIKSLLPIDGKRVARDMPALGIGTAESSATMPAGSTLDRPTFSDPAVVHATAAVAEVKSDSTAALPPVALPSTAHRAVEAVLNATERFAARDQHSVNLQFTVGGSDLNVRVEMRAGEVHTTFRTDSAELRAALSNEWQTVTAQNSDRATRLAAPVFTSSSGNATTGDGTSQQRQYDAESRAQSTFTALPTSRSTGSMTASGPDAPHVRTSAANSVHLHTLA